MVFQLDIKKTDFSDPKMVHVILLTDSKLYTSLSLLTKIRAHGFMIKAQLIVFSDQKILLTVFQFDIKKTDFSDPKIVHMILLTYPRLYESLFSLTKICAHGFMIKTQLIVFSDQEILLMVFQIKVKKT